MRDGVGTETYQYGQICAYLSLFFVNFSMRLNPCTHLHALKHLQRYNNNAYINIYHSLHALHRVIKACTVYALVSCKLACVVCARVCTVCALYALYILYTTY